MDNSEDLSNDLAGQLLALIKTNTHFSLKLSGKYVSDVNGFDSAAKQFVTDVIEISASYDSRSPIHTKGGTNKIDCHYCKGTGKISNGR
ncbi:hypothetical protein [Rheinheimera sp.]|uniref:hypothetical protein n=1 Tax=Rheinheimera sp. TaxID=1869214 RepID=UPI002735A189|nr:hypothetical protein [Rheinheimera sp.]MDP2716438.1 hypothetical protein [Rheinheimera sp.]